MCRVEMLMVDGLHLAGGARTTGRQRNFSMRAVLIGLGTAALLLGRPASAQAPEPVLAPPRLALPAGQQHPADGAHPFDASDVNSRLDGYMPEALANGDIAGAVVVVVKDGAVLTERGFGVSDMATKALVDPERTLFRPGSTSKLFTWTAVMQQVEAGRLNLDQDINAYLDFDIPADHGKPITLRDLMTHTAGFEESLKGVLVPNAGGMRPLGAFLKAWVPARLFAPGEVPAYSNYGAALAGYIVERVSGEKFSAYIEHRILRPLGMANSTFEQPIPSAWQSRLSKSYFAASGPPNPFEFLQISPAGSMTTTGADMARFMIAHLDDGQFGAARILMPGTARLMHAPAFTATPPLPGMALGFYHEDRNGHVIIGHGGDTVTFHSDMHLLLNDRCGLFVSFNSRGAHDSVYAIRELLFRQFVDRYFPAPAEEHPVVASARADAVTLAGTYIPSRRSDTTFFHLAYLLVPTRVAATADGDITLSDQASPGGALQAWHEIAPFVWQNAATGIRLAAVVRRGTVRQFGLEGAPFEVYQPAVGAYAHWNLTVLEASLAALAISALVWPVAALVRWRYRQPFPFRGRVAILYRLVRGVAVIDVLLAVGWMTILSQVQTNVVLLNGPLDPWLRLLQALGLAGIAGGVVGVLNAVLVWRERQAAWRVKVQALLLAFATLGAAWSIVGQRLVTASLNY